MTGFKDVSARLSFSYKLITKNCLGIRKMVKKARKLLTLPSANRKVQKWLLFGFSLLLFFSNINLSRTPFCYIRSRVSRLDPEEEEEEESPHRCLSSIPRYNNTSGEGAGFIFPPSLERGERSLLVLVLSGEEYRR